MRVCDSKVKYETNRMVEKEKKICHDRNVCLPNSFLEPVQLLLQDNKLCSKVDTERK